MATFHIQAIKYKNRSTIPLDLRTAFYTEVVITHPVFG